MIDELTFKSQIAKHDEMKILVKKLEMLKEGLKNQRLIKKQAMDNLKQKEKMYLKIQKEMQWKQRQNQTLSREIKNIQGEILDQRNKKYKLREELNALQSSGQSDQARTVDSKH